MDTSVAKGMIRVIRAELDSRKRDFRATEDPDMGDLWPAMDEPFFNELCLALLVALRHQVERELVLLSAKVTSDRRDLYPSEYKKLVEEERDLLWGKKKTSESRWVRFMNLLWKRRHQKKSKSGWPRIIKKLNLRNIDEWNKSMKLLQLLANSYKHEPMATPAKDLLKHLELDEGRSYDSLPESRTLKEGLAAFLDLPDRADYCDIADELVDRVDRFLADVRDKAQQQLVLSQLRFELANSLDPDSFSGE